MKKEGIIGLAAIAVIVVLAAVFLLPKDLEGAVGHGFTKAQVVRIQVRLSPLDSGSDAIETNLPAGDDAFVELLTLLDKPSYSRTQIFGSAAQQVSLPYLVDLRFQDADGMVWGISMLGGKTVQAGPGGEMKTYQISGGQETQQEILDFLLKQAG